MRFFPIKNKNAKISSSFGWRKNPFTGLPQYHNAIDISIPTGTEVFSPLPGLVTKTGETKDLGKFIYILSGDYKFIFGHLSKLKVNSGDTVTKENPIALSGSSGKVTGSHLHFAVYYKNQAIDPLSDSPSPIPLPFPSIKKPQSVIFIILPLLALYTIFKRK